jgi:hypothetical protein
MATHVSNNNSHLFPGESERLAKRLTEMAADYRARGDEVSAQNCETKARTVLAAKAA